MPKCKWCGKGYEYNYITHVNLDSCCSPRCLNESLAPQREAAIRSEKSEKAFNNALADGLLAVFAKREEEAKNRLYLRECPKCAETVKAKALLCKECGYEFPDGEERRQQIADWEERGKRFGLEAWDKEGIEKAEWKLTPEGQEAERKKREQAEAERVIEEETERLRKRQIVLSQFSDNFWKRPGPGSVDFNVRYSLACNTGHRSSKFSADKEKAKLEEFEMTEADKLLVLLEKGNELALFFHRHTKEFKLLQAEFQKHQGSASVDASVKAELERHWNVLMSRTPKSALNGCQQGCLVIVALFFIMMFVKLSS